VRGARGSALGVAALLILLLAESAPWAESSDAVGRLVDDLSAARSFKVRVHAATLLARLRDPRAVPALMDAAEMDSHPAVRGAAVRLLSRVARNDSTVARQVRPVIGRALGDRDPSVRRQAAAARADLDRLLSPPPPPVRPVARPRGAPLLVAVGAVGDRTGRAPRAMRERMRAHMLALLGRQPRVQVAALDDPNVSFLVDGAISRLQLGPSGQDVEALCAVELVVSRPPRGIVTVASGEAVVQKPRTRFQPSVTEGMQEEALEHAVRGAYENLAAFLAVQ
jgi:hypothetical protein